MKDFYVVFPEIETEKFHNYYLLDEHVSLNQYFS